MRRQLQALLIGFGVIISTILITSFILALFLRLTSFHEPTLSWVTFFIGFIAFFLGGFTAGAKSKGKGWLIGAATGGIFTIFIFLIQAFGNQASYSLQQIMAHISYLFASTLGGILGLNLMIEQKKSKK